MKTQITVQVDLDGLWTIYRYHGLEYDLWPDPVYSHALPRFLDLFAEYDICATFFIVGIDSIIPEKKGLLQQITGAGHELANHTYSHPVPFSILPHDEIQKEIMHTNQVIEDLTGFSVKGFRAPAYDINEKVWTILEKIGFTYDASIFPCFWAPLMSKIEKMKSGENKPKGNFGYGKYGFAPIHPYYPDPQLLNHKGISKLREIPVSVYPVLRLPFHRSITQFLGEGYFYAGIKLNAIFKNPLSVLFHGVELVDSLRDRRLPSLKRIDTSFPQRLDEIRKMLKYIKKEYRTVHTCEIY